MRTTIDLPDPLFKEAKVTAAQRGVPLRRLMEDALRRELHAPTASPATSSRGRLRKKNGFLVIESKSDFVIDPTPEQLDDWL